MKQDNIKNDIKKIGKVYQYLFESFPFPIKHLDYKEYWKRYKKLKVEEIFRYVLLGNIIEKEAKVLDIGCGEGSLLDYLHKVKKVEGKGVDISEEAIKTAIEKGINAKVVDITSEDFAINEEYDYIIISAALEHIPNPEELILKTKRKFNKYLLIIIPNTGFIIDRLRLLFGRFPKQWIFHPSEHLRFWSVEDFIFWCSQLGLNVKNYYGIMEEYSNIRLFPKLWKYYPKLFSKDVLYLLIEDQTH